MTVRPQLLGVLVAVAGVVAALLLAASEHLLWEVEGDAPSHPEGTVVDQAEQEANPGAVQGPHVVETCQIAAGQVLVVGAGYLVRAFAAQHWDGAGEEEEDAPWVSGTAAVPGTWDAERLSLAQRKPWKAHGGRQSLA